MRFDFVSAIQLLTLHEGVRRFPYRDSVGKLTIGIGFNLDDEGLYPEEMEFILENRLNKVYSLAIKEFDSFRQLGFVRQMVIVDMLYNMGPSRVKGFKRMWAAIDKKDYQLAAKEMLDSKWARQVHGRADRLALMMETNQWPENL